MPRGEQRQHLQVFQPLHLATLNPDKTHQKGSRSQDPPVHQLFGLVPPPHRQDPLLRQLALHPAPGHKGLRAPPRHQDPLLRQLEAHHGGGGQAKGLVPPKLSSPSLQRGFSRVLSPPGNLVKSDRIMNMAAANPLSESALVKENKLLDMEAKVRALLFELQPPENLQKLESEEGREEHEQQMTAPLILDNSLPEDDKAQSSEFRAPGKTSKFESLLSGISKAMVALESVSWSHKTSPL